MLFILFCSLLLIGVRSQQWNSYGPQTTTRSGSTNPSQPMYPYYQQPPPSYTVPLPTNQQQQSLVTPLQNQWQAGQQNPPTQQPLNYPQNQQNALQFNPNQYYSNIPQQNNGYSNPIYQQQGQNQIYPNSNPYLQQFQQQQQQQHFNNPLPQQNQISPFTTFPYAPNQQQNQLYPSNGLPQYQNQQYPNAPQQFNQNPQLPNGPQQFNQNPQLPNGPQQFNQNPQLPNGPQQFNQNPQLPNGPQQFNQNPQLPNGPQQFNQNPQLPNGPQQFNQNPQLPNGPQQFNQNPNQQFPNAPQQFYQNPQLPNGPQQFNQNPQLPNGPQPFNQNPQLPNGPQPFNQNPQLPNGPQQFNQNPQLPNGPQPFNQNPQLPNGPQQFNQNSQLPNGPQQFNQNPQLPNGPQQFNQNPQLPNGPQQFNQNPQLPNGPQQFNQNQPYLNGPQQFNDNRPNNNTPQNAPGVIFSPQEFNSVRHQGSANQTPVTPGQSATQNTNSFEDQVEKFQAAKDVTLSKHPNLNAVWGDNLSRFDIVLNESVDALRQKPHDEAKLRTLKNVILLYNWRVTVDAEKYPELQDLNREFPFLSRSFISLAMPQGNQITSNRDFVKDIDEDMSLFRETLSQQGVLDVDSVKNAVNELEDIIDYIFGEVEKDKNARNYEILTAKSLRADAIGVALLLALEDKLRVDGVPDEEVWRRIDTVTVQVDILLKTIKNACNEQYDPSQTYNVITTFLPSQIYAMGI